MATETVTRSAHKNPKRKASISSIQSAIPQPLKIFERASRKFSLQHLSFEPRQTSITESQLPASRELSRSSLDTPISPADPRVGGNSSLTFLLIRTLRGAGDGAPASGQDGSSPPETQDEPTPILRNTSSRASLKAVKSHIKRKASNLNGQSVSNRCALCKIPLRSALKIYAFPRTTPAVMVTVRRLYAELDRVSDGATLGTPTPIRASVSPPSVDRGGDSISNRRKFSFPSSKPNSNISSKNPSLGFCLTCFEHLHSLRICWTCGEHIERPEERVSCGWAWWHWGCVGCLLCRVSSEFS